MSRHPPPAPGRAEPSPGPPTPPLLVGSLDVLRAAFVTRVSGIAARATRARGRFAMAVPGGSVASVLLPALGDAGIDWPHTDLFWCDERAVPVESPDSNFGAARAGWLAGGGPAEARLHRMPGEAADLEAAADAYAEELRGALGTPPRLDLVVLGVGEDGHVGSLFPGHPVPDDPARLVVAVQSAPKPPPRRLTLTLSAMRGARSVCLAAFGRAKREAMRQALHDPDSDLPVARVLRGAAEAWILLDPQADPGGGFR